MSIQFFAWEQTNTCKFVYNPNIIYKAWIS